MLIEQGNNHRTLERTERELRKIRYFIPQEWTIKIQSGPSNQLQSPDLQPRFEVKTTDSNVTLLDILNCKTCTFYGQLLADRQTVIPALDYWKENLHPEPIFNAKQWKNLYPLLITHKHGDVNWIEDCSSSSIDSPISEQDGRLHNSKLSSVWRS